MALAQDIKEFLKGIKSLFVGMKITGEYLIKPKVTVNYPWETVGKEGLEGFRMVIQLVPVPPSGNKHKCVACGMCARSCPSNCIKLDVKQTVEEIELPDGKKKKKVNRELQGFYVDFSLCSLCGLCVESCPTKTLQFSNYPYIVGTSRDDFVYNLLEDFKKRYGEEK
ncbi:MULTISPECIES: 4Fe-4S binding protein [unclassified Desulfurobacterium]|uniref:4Fe-4S binding protein n=1 Tax=unclassified Desulfurobacterium TaxID=2639089 RepID=UPI0003B36FBD|nr:MULTISPECIES: 4Fe-4S binding protein [unclassified Desulfurobacterium]